MRSKTLWLTDLGLQKVDSGVIAPGLDPIELRFYPNYGLALEEWEFHIGVLKGNGKVVINEVAFNEEDRFFKVMLQFGELEDLLNIRLFANHARTNFSATVWEGDVLPNIIYLTNRLQGYTGINWDLITDYKKRYPSADLRHFKLPKISVIVPKNSILIASAKSELEHTPENAPIIFKGFHPFQEFHLEVNGFVIGYGGKGGDAGISTILEREVDIKYPTDGMDGGNTVYIEHKTQKVYVDVSRYGCFLAGQGGKGASSFLINSPEKRIHQIGHPGIGGYPNGLNGQLTDIHYKLGLVKENTSPNVSSFGIKHLSYGFNPGVYVGHDLPVTLNKNSCIQPTKDGKSGHVTPKGVVHLNNQRSQKLVDLLISAYGAYVEF